MTGNSTQLGVGVIEHAPSAAIALRLTGSFVVGVMTGSLVGRRAQRSPRPVVLTLVALILRVAALLNALGNANAAIATTVIAMAVENAAFESDGNVHIGLTYMTGTFVKLGQRIADTVTGGKALCLGTLSFLVVVIGSRRCGWRGYLSAHRLERTMDRSRVCLRACGRGDSDKRWQARGSTNA